MILRRRVVTEHHCPGLRWMAGLATGVQGQHRQSCRSGQSCQITARLLAASTTRSHGQADPHMAHKPVSSACSPSTLMAGAPLFGHDRQRIQYTDRRGRILPGHSPSTSVAARPASVVSCTQPVIASRIQGASPAATGQPPGVYAINLGKKGHVGSRRRTWRPSDTASLCDESRSA